MSACKKGHEIPTGKDRCVECQRIRNRDNMRKFGLAGGYIEKSRRARQRHPEKALARVLLRDAVRSGKVQKASACEDCGATTSLHGHHEDYAKPLAVSWLCSKCHGRRHQGDGESRTYKFWQAMMARCYQANHAAFGRYGGRGIEVCERWVSFDNFLADMGERQPGTYLGRIDNAGNFEPGNCRWVAGREQFGNSRGAGAVVFGGVSASLTAHAKMHGLGLATVCSRLLRGWTLDDALTTPVHRRKSLSGAAQPRGEP